MSQAEVKHDYHLVDPSPWPIVGSVGASLSTNTIGDHVNAFISNATASSTNGSVNVSAERRAE